MVTRSERTRPGRSFRGGSRDGVAALNLELVDVAALLREDREAGAAAIFAACVRLVRLDRPKLGVSTELVVDVASEASMRVIRRVVDARSVPSGARLGAWCRRVVANVAKEQRRKEARAHGIGLPANLGRPLPLKDRLAPVLGVDIGWLNLSDRDRRIIDLLLGESTEREVAQIAGVACSTVHRVGSRVAYLVFGKHHVAKRLPPHDAEWAAAVLALPGVTLKAHHQGIVELLAAGRTQRQIGVAVGLSTRAVHQHLFRLGRRYPRTLHGATIIE